MIKLPRSLHQWGKDSFFDILKKELAKPDIYHMLTQLAVTPGKFISDSETSISILASSQNKLNIEVKIGFTFSEIQWGYCCGEEEPMLNYSYCEMCVSINKKTAIAEFAVL